MRTTSWSKGIGHHVIAVAAAMGILLVGAVTGAAEEFTIVVLPDTQNYSAAIRGGDPEFFSVQTNWILQKAAAENIKYVSHVGDVVQNQDDLAQWANAKASMGILEASGVPFGTCVGNHDTHYGANDAKDHDATNYVANFGPDASYAGGGTFADQAWYRGASPSGRSNYQVIQAGGYDFLFMNVSIDCPDEELQWAQGVLDANRDKPTVFSTHRHIYDFKLVAGYYGDAFTGRPEFDHAGLANESYYREDDGTIRTSWPEDVETDFVRGNKQIFAVLAGHCHAQYHMTQTNDFGLPVIEALTDYQDGPLGGAGWMRTMKVNTETGEISFNTFSPLPGLERDRVIADDFAETLVLISDYKAVFGPAMTGFDFGTPEGKAAVAVMIAGDGGANPGMQANLDAQTNPAIADLLAYLAYMEQMDEATRDADPLAVVYNSLHDIEEFVSTYHPEGVAAWDPNGDWDGLYDQVFADGSRDPAWTQTVDFGRYIPEPATLGLMALGLVGLLRHRK